MWPHDIFTEARSEIWEFPRRLPAVLALIPFCAGILIGTKIPHLWAPALLVSMLLSIPAFLASDSRRILGLICLSLALTSFGLSRYGFSSRMLPRDHLAVALPLDDVALVGRVAGMPQSKDDFTSFVLDVEGIETDKAILTTSTGLVRIGVKETAEAAPSGFGPGALVRVEATLDSPSGFRNPGVFNYTDYLAIRGIHVTGDAGYWDFIRVLERPNPWCIIARLHRVRAHLLAWIARSAHPPFPDFWKRLGLRTDHIPGFSQAMILGDRTMLDERTREDFQDTGMYHILAISGFHIAVIAGLIRVLLGTFVRKPGLIASTVIVTLAVYSVLAGLSPSVIRASVMVILACWAILLDRPVRSWNIIGTSAIAILLWNPRMIHDIGFQLTYLATVSILLFSDRFASWLSFIPTRFLRESIAMSLAAQFGTSLVSAYHFNRIGILAFVPYLLTFPLITGVIWSGAVGLASGWIPWFGEWCLRIHALLIVLFSEVVHLFSRLPLTTVRVLTPGWPEALLFLSTAGIVLSMGRRPRITGIFLLAGILAVSIRFLPSTDHIGIYFLDVGNADSIIIRLPDGEGIVIDTGGAMNSTIDFGRMIVGRMLNNLRIRKIAVLVGTHEHPDHIGGMRSIIEDHSIDSLWISSCLHAGYEMMKLIEVARSRGIRIDELQTGRMWHRLPLNGNDRSIVLAMEYGSLRILFPGDAELASESGLLDYGGHLRSDILKVGHHGSRTSSGVGFLKAVDPRFAIIPCGRKNRFGHPHPDVLERLERETDVECVFRSDQNGMISVESDGRMTSMIPFVFSPVESTKQNWMGCD